MWRLVVTAHLPYHGIAVLLVVPEGVVAPRRLSGGGEDTKLIVGCALDDFFAPVAEDVALECRRLLGAVVGICSCHVCNDSPVVLAYGSFVERLFLQVTVPVDSEIHAKTILSEDIFHISRHATDGILVS